MMLLIVILILIFLFWISGSCFSSHWFEEIEVPCLVRSSLQTAFVSQLGVRMWVHFLSTTGLFCFPTWRNIAGYGEQKGNHRLKEGKRQPQAQKWERFSSKCYVIDDARIFGDWCSFNVTIRLIKTQKLVILRSWNAKCLKQCYFNLLWCVHRCTHIHRAVIKLD